MNCDYRNGIIGGVGGSLVGAVTAFISSLPPAWLWIGLAVGSFIGACIGTIRQARQYRDQSMSYWWLLDSIAEGSAAGLVIGGALILLLWGPCWVYHGIVRL